MDFISSSGPVGFGGKVVAFLPNVPTSYVIAYQVRALPLLGFGCPITQ